MSVRDGSLNYLIQTADQINARLLSEVSDTEANFEITVELSDGSSTVYQLNLVAKKNSISAKETTPNLLPASCPERHINLDGSFCIYWKQAQDLSVIDSKSAILWWQHLHGYLVLQVRAAKKRVWPGKEWAHGTAAAFQNIAENAAKALSDEYYNRLIQKKLSVKKLEWRDSRGPILKLYSGTTHLCSVWMSLDMVANKRQPCLCALQPNNKRKRIRSCSDHAHQIKELVKGIYLQDVETELFWETFKGQSCCNSMDICPLKNKNDLGQSA